MSCVNWRGARIAIIGVLSLSMQAHAQVGHTYQPNPNPGGIVAGAASGLEGKNVTYRITARDKDTQTDTGQLEGDPTVDLFKRYETNPWSGTLLGYAQAGYDPVAGERIYDITVKLHLLNDNGDQESGIDGYAAGDTRGIINDGGRWDKILIPGVGWVLLRSNLDQTVTINPKRGTLKGKVTDGQTGLPLAMATVQAWSVESDYAGTPAKSAFTNFAGNYTILKLFAGASQAQASKAGYDPSPVASLNIPRDGEATRDFSIWPWNPP